MKREFLQLAHVMDPGRHIVSCWLGSEKLDGMRAFWDGGVTRGMRADCVPFANVEKDARYVNRMPATGLWSRYAKTIQAPDWWLDRLPLGVNLDGELYMGRGRFQDLISATKQLVADERWREITYMAFDSPPDHAVFANGDIRTTNLKKRLVDVLPWIRAERDRYKLLRAPERWDFTSVLSWLYSQVEVCDSLKIHEQVLLGTTATVGDEIARMLDEVTSGGGEGLMLRHPTSLWVPQRSHTLLKVKPCLDSEARVLGYTWGRETDLGSKLLGKMGALIVEWRGVRFELSGFTDEERTMSDPIEGFSNPGSNVTSSYCNPNFPRGSTVSFKYRELSDTGVPKEARYWRKPC